MQKINVAAIQMTADLGNVEINCNKAKDLIANAFIQGANLVLLPELFSTAIAYNPIMLQAIVASSVKSLKFILDMAKTHKGIVGGSYLKYENGNVYNCFALAFPDGKCFFHKKDIPTMWENCYYIGGNDDGVMKTPIGNIGVTLCWEMLRTQTVNRLKSNIDLVLACSCWWGTPTDISQSRLDVLNRNLLRNAPVRMSRLLGVPVIHASHAGNFFGYRPPNENQMKMRQYLGETMVIDKNGCVMNKMSAEEGEGFILTELQYKHAIRCSEIIREGYWLQDIPSPILKQWEAQESFGKKYYKEKTLPFLSTRIANKTTWK